MIEQLTPLVRDIALQAGIREERYMTNPPRPTGCYLVYAPALERFAALVAKECARIAGGTYEGSDVERGDDFYGELSSAAILMAFPMPPAGKIWEKVK